MFHFAPETAQARETRQKKEIKRLEFNRRVIKAGFNLESIEKRDQERLKRSFAKKIIGIQQLQARPGDFQLINSRGKVYVWWEKGNIGGEISTSDTYESSDDIPELSCTLIEKVNNVLRFKM